MGYRPLAVHIRPDRASGPGSVQRSRSAWRRRGPTAVAGTVTVVPPPGWTADPPERPFRLAPGAHLAFETSITAPRGRACRAATSPRPGSRTRRGQVHEDVITLDLVPAAEETDDGIGGSAALASAAAADPAARGRGARGGEIGVAPARPRRARAADARRRAPGRAAHPGVRVAAGESASCGVSLRNRSRARSAARRSSSAPTTRGRSRHPGPGLQVGPGEETTLSFAVEPPSDFRPAPGGGWSRSCTSAACTTPRPPASRFDRPDSACMPRNTSTEAV